MARPTWKGTLGFGLVQLLVELFPATHEDDLDFRMLDGRDLAAVGYQRINKRTKKEVPFGEIVKGVEVSKGKFVVVTPEDMKAALPKATRSIDITDFVDGAAISPIRWSDSYFIAPDKKASPKAYAVLRDAMKASGKVGIAKVVLRSRQHLCAIAVEGNALVLALLRFDTELRDRAEVEAIEKANHSKSTKKELELAEMLIDNLSGDFEPARYHDEYQDALREFVKHKATRGAVGDTNEAESESSSSSNVLDLLAALKQSLEKPRAGAKRSVASAKDPAKPATKKATATGRRGKTAIPKTTPKTTPKKRTARNAA